MSHLIAAESPSSVIGQVVPPNPITNLTNYGGAGGISIVLTNIIHLLFILAPTIFLFMVIISGIQWITSGGDKESVARARARITYAVIGLMIVGLAFMATEIVTKMLSLPSVVTP